ncbi:HPr family phosphocarrier protein [Aquibacillus albus]|uniref:Catabolite repression HPr-like protein n=1 Tax=Aquibacillus albus TaxID=1168171 RepID=A0ABS2MYT6_9BACI|nr:HPr family phosphocarrier protein [Aquibacillus albus]MBM7571059.1 catabolite repression HPr-like protein [Aquibacillus albus]
MVEKSVVVTIDSGLQARPAAEFVRRANNFTSELFIEKGEKRINAKSIMGLMSLAIASGEEITIIADGADDQVAIDELSNFVTKQ